MPSRRRQHLPPVVPGTPYTGRGNNGGRSLSRSDWEALLRRLERKRRQVERGGGGDGEGTIASPRPLPAHYYVHATWVSFRLEGLDVSEEEVREALGTDRPILRSRQSQRLRNHAAILHRIENDLGQSLPLTTDGVIRWYVAVSAGLSTTALDQATASRLEEVVRRINSPQLRLQPALQEVAAAHSRLLADPLVPSFNGILARLLLRYHLGRCKLPPVVFEPVADARPAIGEAMLRRLAELLEDAYDRWARDGRG